MDTRGGGGHNGRGGWRAGGKGIVKALDDLFLFVERKVEK